MRTVLATVLVALATLAAPTEASAATLRATAVGTACFGAAGCVPVELRLYDDRSFEVDTTVFGTPTTFTGTWSWSRARRALFGTGTDIRFLGRPQSPGCVTGPVEAVGLTGTWNACLVP